MQSTNNGLRQLTLTGGLAAPKARATRSRPLVTTRQSTLNGNPEEAFLGSRGGLPTRKAQLQAMTRAMGLSADGTIAQLRSRILVGLGRSTPEIQQQRSEATRQRSRSQSTQRQTAQSRSDERRQEQALMTEIENKLRRLGTVDEQGRSIDVVNFDRERADMRRILETILRVFPNTRFLIGANGTFITLTPENIMRILALTRRIRAGELDYVVGGESGEGGGEEKKSDEELEEIEVAPDIQVRLAPT